MSTYRFAIVVSAGLMLSSALTTPSEKEFARSIGVASAPQSEYIGNTGSKMLQITGELTNRQISRAIFAQQPDSQTSMPLDYPNWIHVTSAVVVIGTVLALLIGYFLPGPLTGAALPAFATAWWLLYRIIKERDTKRSLASG